MRSYYLPMVLLAMCYNSWGQKMLSSAAEAYALTPRASMPIELFQISQKASPPDYLPLGMVYQVLTPSMKALRELYESSPELLRLVIPQDKQAVVILELERVKILADDFFIDLHTEGRLADRVSGIHYRGRIMGQEHSLAVISIFPDEVIGLWRSEDMPGNWVLGGMKDMETPSLHLLYQDGELTFNSNFFCAMQDLEVVDEKTAPYDKNKATPCIGMFIEADYDIFKDKGGAANTIKFITSLFNQIAAVFAQDDIAVQLSQLYIWNVPSPYNGTTVEKQLQQFQEYRTEWQGNLAQLLNYKVNGGVAAGFEGLCAPYSSASMSYAGIESSFSSIPNYSWSVNVVAHEFGHLMGVRHTHACVWNGNGTSIDDCGNVYMEQRDEEPEGVSCYSPGQPKYPEDGGTLMSYCHLIKGVGINLIKGFHEQPAAFIQDRLRSADCLSECTPQEASNVCVGNTITLSLALDNFGSETYWKVKDENGMVLYHGGPYSDGLGDRVIEQEFCLGVGCFTFEIQDGFGDGICCFYGKGFYTLTDTSGYVIAQGGTFQNEDRVSFCLPVGSDANQMRDDCQIIDFNDFTISSYGGIQDEGDFQIRDDGMTIRLWGNAWKSIPLNYEVTPYTILEFDFGSTASAEIHGIGLDTDEKVSSNRTFKLFGSQNWGVLQYFHYEYPGEWMPFIIPIGMHFTGPVNKMFFCVDDDIAPKNGDSWFRNIRIYESEDCMVSLARPTGTDWLAPDKQLSMHVFPNPAREEIKISLDASDDGVIDIKLLTLMGQILRHEKVLYSGYPIEESFWVNDLPRGAYLIKVEIGNDILVDKVMITR